MQSAFCFTPTGSSIRIYFGKLFGSPNSTLIRQYILGGGWMKSRAGGRQWSNWQWFGEYFFDHYKHDKDFRMNQKEGVFFTLFGLGLIPVARIWRAVAIHLSKSHRWMLLMEAAEMMMMDDIRSGWDDYVDKDRNGVPIITLEWLSDPIILCYQPILNIF